MGKKSRILIGTFAIVMLGTLAWLLLKPAEPTYEGEPLIAWLQRYEDLNDDTVTDQIWHREADEAVRKIGTNAIPLLLELLEARDSKFKLKVMAAVRRQSIFKIHLTTAEVRHQMALGGFEALGPGAGPAVPALGKMLADGQLNAAEALDMIGPESIGTLTNALTNANPKVRIAVVMALNRYATLVCFAPEEIHWHVDSVAFQVAKTQAIPALRRCTNDPDGNTRQLAGKIMELFNEADSTAAKAGVK